MARSRYFSRILKFTNNTPMKILLLIVLASTATSFAQSTEPPINYDITSQLNDSIARTFQNLNPDVLQELISSMKNDIPIKFDTGINYIFNPFQNEFHFSGVNITISSLESVHIRHAFPTSELTLLIPKLSIKIEGFLGATNDTIHVGFMRSVDFENVSIITFKLPHQQPEGKLYVYLKYEEDFESNYIYSPWFHQDIRPEARYELERKIKQMLPSLFLDNLQHNEKFLKSLNTTFCNHPQKEIASLRPDFKHNPGLYHYFIPNITSLERTLSNISIAGLWNFHSHSFSVNLGQFITTLIIKNIRGNATLYYGSQNSTLFPLNFEADCISILIDGKMQRVSISAYNYSVYQTNMNRSLTEHQSKWVMGGIKLAIGSSILPSMKVYRDEDESSSTREEHPIAKISSTMSQNFQGSTIQKLYQDWNISIPDNITTESNLQIDSFDYNISVFCAPTQAYTPSPYPDWIQCKLYDSLKISFGLPWFLLGKIRLTNSTHKSDEISFTMSDIFGGIVKRNNSKKSDDFELSYNPNIEVRILSEPDEGDFTQTQLDVIVQKTKQMLTSSIFEILKLLTKPLPSLPLDYCTAPIELFDDFLPFFADHELAYYVPNADNRSNDQFFTSKMTNVVIEEWTTTPSVWVSFYNQDGDGDLLSIVNTELDRTKVRMSLNDSSIQADESEMVFEFRSAVLKNITDTGAIIVHFYYDHDKYPIRNNVSSSARESYWLKGKLEYIIAESFKNITKID